MSIEERYSAKPFTDSQRELFGTGGSVERLNRSEADRFVEADKWINTKPPTAKEEYAQFKKFLRIKADERRKRKDRSHGIELSFEVDGYGCVSWQWRTWRGMIEFVPAAHVVHYYLQRCPNAFLPWEGSGEDAHVAQYVLDKSRRYFGRALRNQRRERFRRIREEKEHGPLRPDELLDLASSRFIRTDDPLCFDSMPPELKECWARRLLRVVWILADTADLTTTKLDWLRKWNWGEHYLDGMFDSNRPCRLWSSVTILKRHIDEWEKWTNTALIALEQGEPGVTKATVSKATNCILPIRPTNALEADECGWKKNSEAAAILGLTPGRITQLCEDGKLDSVGVGSDRRINPVSLTDYQLEQRRKENGSAGQDDDDDITPARKAAIDLRRDLIDRENGRLSR